MLLWLQNKIAPFAAKKKEFESFWYFIAVQIVRKTLYGCLRIINSLLMLKNILQ